jgi:hypothetical protein
MRLAITLVAALLLSAATAGATGQRTGLRLVATSPVTVTGTEFRAAELVRLTLTAGGRTTVTRVRTARTGRLRAVFAGRVLPECARWVVIATGARGSRASLTRPPALDCPPPPPIE